MTRSTSTRQIGQAVCLRPQARHKEAWPQGTSTHRGVSVSKQIAHSLRAAGGASARSVRGGSGAAAAAADVTTRGGSGGAAVTAGNVSGGVTLSASAASKSAFS